MFDTALNTLIITINQNIIWLWIATIAAGTFLGGTLLIKIEQLIKGKKNQNRDQFADPFLVEDQTQKTIIIDLDGKGPHKGSKTFDISDAPGTCDLLRVAQYEGVIIGDGEMHVSVFTDTRPNQDDPSDTSAIHIQNVDTVLLTENSSMVGTIHCKRLEFERGATLFHCEIVCDERQEVDHKQGNGSNCDDLEMHGNNSVEGKIVVSREAILKDLSTTRVSGGIYGKSTVITTTTDEPAPLEDTKNPAPNRASIKAKMQSTIRLMTGWKGKSWHSKSPGQKIQSVAAYFLGTVLIAFLVVAYANYAMLKEKEQKHTPALSMSTGMSTGITTQTAKLSPINSTTSPSEHEQAASDLHIIEQGIQRTKLRIATIEESQKSASRKNTEMYAEYSQMLALTKQAVTVSSNEFTRLAGSIQTIKAQIQVLNEHPELTTYSEQLKQLNYKLSRAQTELGIARRNKIGYRVMQDEISEKMRELRPIQSDTRG